jgi:stage III sporulation protein AH
VCAGILATKVNSPLYVDSKDITDSTSNNKKGDFFTESRLDRDQNYAQTVPTYRTVIDDPNATKEAKDTMVQKLKTFTTNNENEQKVENALKGKSFTDSFCQIFDNKVTVYVKSSETKLTDQQIKDIKNTVLNITKIKDVEIAVKQ